MIAKAVKTTSASGDPRRLVSYILDNKAGKHGDRVEESWAANAGTDDPRAAAAVMRHHQEASAGNRQTDPTYHLVISFQQEDADKLSAQDLRDIEERLVGCLDLGDHSRVAAVHGNTANLHMHVAIDLLDDEGRSKRPRHDFRKLKEERKKIEKEYDLQPNKKRDEDKPRGSDRAATADRQQPFQSFEAWSKENLAQPIYETLNAKGASWGKLHDELAKHGVELKKRGAGLVVAQKDGKLFTKASSVSRALTLGKLEKQLGSFTASASKVEASTSYKQTPPSPSKALYEDFKEHRSAVLDRRKADRAENLTLFRKAKKIARQVTKERRDRLRPLKPSVHKTAAYRIAKLEEARAIEAAKEALSDANKATTAREELPSWVNFLEAKANEGDERAVSALKRRSKAPDKGKHNHFANTKKDAEARLLRDLSYKVDQSGTVNYQTKDGSLFRDTGNHLNLGKASEDQAIAAALELAISKFGSTLEINGSDDFKEKVAQIAAERKLPIKFSDRKLEARRRQLAKPKGRGDNSR